MASRRKSKQLPSYELMQLRIQALEEDAARSVRRIAALRAHIEQYEQGLAAIERHLESYAFRSYVRRKALEDGA